VDIVLPVYLAIASFFRINIPNCGNVTRRLSDRSALGRGCRLEVADAVFAREGGPMEEECRWRGSFGFGED